jgi:hypothetical protein
VLSGDAYRVKIDGEERPGLFAVLAVGAGRTAAEAHATLRAATERFDHPITWRALAEEAGDVAASEQHAALAALYGL